MDRTTFDKSKIHEVLEYKPEPEGYNGKLPWLVQVQIAATNGKQYGATVGKLKDYPRYELPVKKANCGLMLDIGCGWGRWLVGGHDKGYLPIGVDLRIEFCKSTLQTLKDHRIAGYVVAGDLKELPFKEGIFDLIWSFSVIQHTHKDRLVSCLKGIHRTLRREGNTKLEFPNSEGFRNKLGPVMQSQQKADDYNSWVVRYYSIPEYRSFFMSVFKNFSYAVHSFLGIGVLKEDLKYVSLKNKIFCGISLVATRIAKILPFLSGNADSIYITATKNDGCSNENAITGFLALHENDPGNNLNIVALLQCPVSNESLEVSESDPRFVYNTSHTVKYPVIGTVPLIIRSEAVML